MNVTANWNLEGTTNTVSASWERPFKGQYSLVFSLLPGHILPPLYLCHFYPCTTYHSTLQMDATDFSVALAMICKSTWHYIPEDSNLLDHEYKNLKTLHCFSLNPLMPK
jgi:hypothetical protein